MPTTREEAFEALFSMRPAKVFLDSYRMKILPENLDFYFGPPDEFFIEPEAQELYTGNYLIPILDDGNFDLIIFLDPATREIIEMDIESPYEYRTVFKSWQQYLASLMMRIREGVDEDERVIRMAHLIGFEYLEELFSHFTQTAKLQSDAWQEAQDRFIADIPA
ncbi:hypothetical protein [Paralysiella testudinis]|uniref:Uncharacterized protein n=1 Tax=Paralysiella testudinis TaxID=2809020 RepID=A0A892ZBI6_9NEIS|nr:hypothetical protein [Paralysiella testudinis]QRQ80635.1 hypothetical protein JQU52_07585 [Paralysiella testudinis]